MQVTPELELEQLKVKLLEAGYDSKTVETNLDVVEDALRTSKQQDGLGVPVLVDVPSPLDNVKYETPKQALNVQSGGYITRAERDPVKIFEIYDIKQRDVEQRKKYYSDLIAAAERDWYYYDLRTPSDQRYSAYLGKQITKEYFLENLYRCPYDMTKRCIVRYKDPNDARPHYH